MPFLFRETVESWEDWGRVFQSVPAFTELVREIFRREKLPFESLRNLTPGTNAVFRSGDVVAKVFFPSESGLDPFPDFRNEAAVCRELTRRGIPTPPLLAEGVLDDRYRFYYLLTGYVEGREAGAYLASASEEEKRRFARSLRELLRKLNLPAPGVIPEKDLTQEALENFRLDRLPAPLRRELTDRAASLDPSNRVLVHGDLTGENLLVGREGELTVIDCADACLAPRWYELGPIVFELFHCDPVLLRTFAEGEDAAGFAERVLDALSLHPFGPDLFFSVSGREGIPVFSHLNEVGIYLQSVLNG